MRQSLFLLLLFVFTLTFSQENPENTKKRVEAKGSISINSNGIAYIPAFSLDKPAIIGSFTLRKNRFSYDPILSYGLDLRPWIIDNWLHYKIVDRAAFEFIAGGVISAFFSEYEIQDGVLWRAPRYVAIEGTGKYKFAHNSSLFLTCLYDRGLDQGTLQGLYINLGADKSDIQIGKAGLLSASLQVFYINYTDNNDGLFITPKISFSLRNIPFAFYLQAIQALDSNIMPNPGFKWNAGLSYSL